MLISASKLSSSRVTARVLFRSFEEAPAVLDVEDSYYGGEAKFVEMFDVWYQKRDITQDYIHPTQKPVRLCERALRKHSEIGDIVIDLFSGSGSTIIGCEQGQRRARVMELDPKYVHAGIKRFMRMRPDAHTKCLNRDVDMSQFKS